MLNAKQQFGKEGELIARKYLEDRGYIILGANISTDYGEIDLVAQKDKKIYFVEIRRRRGLSYGSALGSISETKQRHIRRSAQFLLLQNKDWQKLIPYLSAIAIDENERGETSLEFLPDAFS